MSRRVWNFTGQRVRLGSADGTLLEVDGEARLVQRITQRDVLVMEDGSEIPGTQWNEYWTDLHAPWDPGSPNYDEGRRPASGDVVLVRKDVAQFMGWHYGPGLGLGADVQVWVPGRTVRQDEIIFAPSPERYIAVTP